MPKRATDEKYEKKYRYTQQKKKNTNPWHSGWRRGCYDPKDSNSSCYGYIEVAQIYRLIAHEFQCKHFDTNGTMASELCS
jgi:hypothetical protein